jgi:hypothetical protein
VTLLRAFIIFRDRVTYGRLCLAAMQAAGLETTIVDHGTTWPEAVDWLRDVQKAGVRVVDDGGGNPRDLWTRGWFRAANAREKYVVTDPDVVPSEGCPLDWPWHLAEVLSRHPRYHKAGLGLRIDRIPAHYSQRENVIGWEAHFWDNEVEPGVFHADVDTTLAVHVPMMDVGCHSFSAVRTGFPYVADHLAWHEDYANLSAELAYYHAHAEPGISCWTPKKEAPWDEAGTVLPGRGLQGARGDQAAGRPRSLSGSSTGAPPAPDKVTSEEGQADGRQGDQVRDRNGLVYPRDDGGDDEEHERGDGEHCHQLLCGSEVLSPSGQPH